MSTVTVPETTSSGTAGKHEARGKALCLSTVVLYQYTAFTGKTV